MSYVMFDSGEIKKETLDSNSKRYVVGRGDNQIRQNILLGTEKQSMKGI